MVTIVWRTDVHMSDKAPSSRTDDWVSTVLGKLGQVREVARSRDASLILDGGDFFHVKSPTRNSHEVVRRVADHHATYPCPVYCTPGNHDSVYGDYEFLGQQPLGVLYSTNVFKRLYDEHEVYIGPADDTTSATRVYPYNRAHISGDGESGLWLDGNPFNLKRDSSRPPIVRIVGIPYHGTSYDMSRFTGLVKGEEDILICVAHVLASAKGGTMFEGEDIVRYSDLVDTAPDMYCFGHWHKDQGVVEIAGKTFLNIGSLTRGALSQDEVQRRPACAIICCSAEGVSVETHRLDVSPAEEVFDVAKRHRQVKQQSDMDSFITTIQESLSEEKEDTQSVSSVVRGLEDISQEVKERALMYLEKA